MGPRSIVCVCWQRHRTWWGRIYYPRWHAEQERKTKKKKRKKEGRCKMNMKTKI